MANLTADAREWLCSQFVDSDDAVGDAPALPLQLALVTETGDTDNAGSEVSGEDYERQELALEFDDGSLVNTDPVSFGEADGTVAGIAVYDDNDVRWWYGELRDQYGNTTTLTLSPGYTVEFAAGDIELSFE